MRSMPPRLRFVVDENIPLAREALAPLGEVTALPSARLGPETVRDADILWTRSTVSVDAALLEGSRVRMVATATIGTDHLDIDWLTSRGIAWASAPGSNAPSVRLWWAAALGTLAERQQLALGRLRVGIVGVGQVGRRIEAFARALGCEVLRCDPPRAQVEGPQGFVSLSELCETCDVITIHVPLTREGPDATYHLFDAARLGALRPGTILINASRGQVIDTPALLAAQKAKDLTVLLDVYEGEPAVPPAVVQIAALATPHIAGHSLDGKVAGTRMIYDATCAHLGIRPQWNPERSLPPLPVRVLTLDTRELPEDRADEVVVLKVVRRFYRIEEDDQALRDIVRLEEGARGAAFSRYRSNYPVHREPLGLELELVPPRPRAAAALTTLGVKIVER
jgi:erythronate-4-phosphate dehydrogenase